MVMIIMHHILLGGRSVIGLLTLYSIVKNGKDCDKYYAQCGRFWYESLSLKQSLCKELESVLAM
jgi:hypothetical protein